MTDASSKPSKPRRRSLQFSLRTLLIVVTLAAGLLVAWRVYVEPYRRRLGHQFHRCTNRVMFVFPARTEILYRQDQLGRAYRKAASEEGQEAEERYDAITSVLRHLDREANILLRAALLAQGWRQSRRRGWIRLRGAQMIEKKTGTPASGLPSREDFDRLVDQAEHGDADALAELRAVVRNNPDIWRPIGNLASHTKELLLEHVVGRSIPALEAVKAHMEEMTADLSDGDTSPVERLLVERVVISWLDLQAQQLAFSQQRDSRTERKYWEDRLHRAQKRHLDSIEMLTKVRIMLAKSSEV